MSESQCDVLVVGGGTGGTAAAHAAASLGVRVILTEETDWLGGQLTAQAVPPDEHPWIERFGATRTYRAYREAIRRAYRESGRLTNTAAADPHLNPGNGWVSKLCHAPAVGAVYLQDWLTQAGVVTRYRRKPYAVDRDGHHLRAVTFRNLETGESEVITAKVILDATELGDLLAIANLPYCLGAESKSETLEPHAVDGPAEPDNVQGITWVFAMGWFGEPQPARPAPENYEFWRSYRPVFKDGTAPWPGPLLSFEVLHAHTGQARRLPLFNPDDWYELFSYRQIIDPQNFRDHVEAATIVNWPQNDYFEASIIDVDPIPQWDHPLPGASGPVSAERLMRARQLSESLLYWLQTEAPRHDGGVGYPEMEMRPELTSTPDGFAKYPYIRESRRIVARLTVREQDVSADLHPGRDRAPEMPDSVGIGAYRMDLHPSTNQTTTIDTSTLPFQLPMGMLIPAAETNLLAAAKNVGVTHLTNGCFRLHPIEWNLGEAAGIWAALAVNVNVPVAALYEDPVRKTAYLSALEDSGIERRWPEDETLRSL